jgi:hypothetical protein
MAFEDTWEWNMDAEAAYEEIVERGGRVSDAMRAFRTFLGHSDMMAYLAMMAPRLIELHRVLKETVGKTRSLSIPMVGAKPGRRTSPRKEKRSRSGHRWPSIFPRRKRRQDETNHPVGKIRTRAGS